MKIIGRYEIDEKLGEGGMGVVYRARDPLLDRVIALKLISASVEGNPELRERFFREARAAGQLSHKNVITIHDLGEHEGQPYLAMEYLQGQDLQRRLSRGVVMSLARKLQLAIEVCEGLEYAHARGVVHRDIKPANIFITEEGTVKLLDFGLARLVTSELTHSNMMMGTLNYMAPEQVRGERADQRSDIFSMGVVLYELLGGRKAFEGDSFAATLYKILQETPEPLLNLDATLPPETVAIVDRALAKSREERYQHMGEMLRDLALVRQQLGFHTSPPTGIVAPGDMPTIPGVPSPASGMPGLRPPSGPRSGPSASPSGSLGGHPPEYASPTPGSAPPGSGPLPAPGRTIPLSRAVVAAAAVLVVLAVAAAWLFQPGEPTPADTGQESARAAEVEQSVEQASLLLRAGDYDAARREADSVLARMPAHEEARRIRDRAQETARTVETGLREARAHFEAGRYDEAGHAAGEVLALAPAHADAKRLMEESTARTRGRGVEDARAQMSEAKSAAGAARAPALAAAAYRAATSAEQDAQRMLKAGRPADATVKFYEASGLFRSAEIAARSEAARAQRARAEAPAPPESKPPPDSKPAEPKPAETKPPEPKPSVPERQVGPPVLPGGDTPRPVPPPAPPPRAPEPPATRPEDAVPPEQAIRDVVARYEAALEAQSLDALKRLWPGLGGAQQTAIANEFKNASRIAVEIRDVRVSVDGVKATATFRRQYELQTVEGQRLRNEVQAAMILRRDRDTWVIDDIRFAPR